MELLREKLVLPDRIELLKGDQIQLKLLSFLASRGDKGLGHDALTCLEAALEYRRYTSGGCGGDLSGGRS